MEQRKAKCEGRINVKRGLMGIDIGGTSVKAVICNENGEILALDQKPTREAYQNANHMVDTGPQRNLNAEALWSIITTVIRGALDKMPKDYMVGSVAVSSVGCTMFAFDQEDHQISIRGNDQMVSEEYEKLYALYEENEFERLTGYPMDRTLTGFHLAGCCGGVEKPEIAKIFTVDDFIVYKLTGIASRNYSTAASNGMWNSQKGCWLDFLKERTGLPDEVLGCPGNSGEKVGTVSSRASVETGLSTDVIVATGGMDYQCAAFAINSIVKGRLFNITGTIDLLVSYEEEQGCFGEKLRSIRDYHVIPNVRSRMVEAVGAAQTEWLKNFVVSQEKYGFSLDWNQFFDGMKQNYEEQPFHSEIYIPQLFGAYVPALDANATGLYGGLNKHTDSQMLLRTMLEGMAYQTKQMADYISGSCSGRDVVLVGGGSKNHTWAQIKADILGRDIVLPEIGEASAVGAALLGGVGAGVYRDHEEAGSVTKNIPFHYIEHNETRSRYYDEIFYEVYHPLIEQWRSVNKKILVINEKHRRHSYENS